MKIGKMNEKEIEKLIKRGESKNLEFKESLSVKEEIGESISAFSNSCDGKILIGVSNLGEIKGVQIGKKTIEGLANFIKQNTDNHIYPNIKVEKINNKNIIIIEVNEAKEKPVFFKGKAYTRIGKSTHKLSASEIRKMAKESTKSYWDAQICKEAILEDINKEVVKKFLRKAKYERRLEIDENISVEEGLKKLDLILNGKLTNAAILLFGENPQKFFLQAETRCARFKGTEPIEFIDMKVFGRDIIEQRENAVEFIKEHIKLHAKIVGTERVEKWEYPIEAIREAVTNAICHRDYETSSNVQVRVFDDGIEVWNPGKLPKDLTIEKLKGKHESILRNPLIGKNFFLIKYIEQWGTGTNRIIKECLKHSLPEPVFEETGMSFVVTFKKPFAREELLEIGLNERQIKAIDYIKKRGSIVNKEYQQINNVARNTAARDLTDLVKKRILARVGKGKRGLKYILVLHHNGAKMVQKQEE